MNILMNKIKFREHVYCRQFSLPEPARLKKAKNASIFSLADTHKVLVIKQVV